MWKERNERGIEGEPPCWDCWVDPLPANTDAFKIFNLTRRQLILSMSGVVDINQLAIHENMRLYRIKNRQECFEKVLILACWLVNRLNEKDG